MYKNKLTVISVRKSCAIYKNQLMPGFISMLYKDLLHVFLAKITTVKTFNFVALLFRKIALVAFFLYLEL